VRSDTSAAHLIVGLDTPDDAAVYRIADDIAIVQSVDFFTPIVDDAFAWGRIAAANALSDLYAMGARPLTALNLVAWPRLLGFDLLGRVLEGAAEGCDEAEVAVVGGHSIDDPEPKFGMAVTGQARPGEVVRKTGAPPGSELVLTKPLGMGIISSGIKEGKTSGATAAKAIRVMSSLNRAAAAAMLEVGVAAATDITGFGLLGHLREMLGDDLSAELSFADIPVLDEAFELAAAGVLPAGSKRNYEAFRGEVDTGDLDFARRSVLFDAQTSGGLLIAIEPEDVDKLLVVLDEKGVGDAAAIGRIIEGKGTVTVR
jgi:selenide,water dikinase